LVGPSRSPLVARTAPGIFSLSVIITVWRLASRRTWAYAWSTVGNGWSYSTSPLILSSRLSRPSKKTYTRSSWMIVLYLWISTAHSIGLGRRKSISRHNLWRSL
jgi:hypothetical protein